ncbi:MAG: hypothetical protein SFZ24_01740 [Planctomycetota bacterium]|nr:hypothetical protein [Planctomycetota bacterium]
MSWTLRAPGDYSLRRDVCSYGYFLLEPNDWDVRRRVFSRPLDLPGGVAVVRVGQPGGKGRRLVVESDRKLTRRDRAAAERMLVRMLRLDDAGVAEFHRVDPRWRASGRGRLFRSPSFFEDLIKTVTSCNVAWPSTMNMNERLCAAFNPAFPSAAQLARKRPATLRARCGVGYRDGRIVELSRLWAGGGIDEEWLSDAATPDEAVFARLLELPGIGPYAAGNLMQLLGRYSRLAIDTETLRHARVVLGYEGGERSLIRAIERHYEPFGAHRFRSYWFEVWAFYEAKRGPSWTWEKAGAGRTFTAALLRDA